MLRVIARGGGEVECEAPEALWYDLEDPTDAEEAEVERSLGIDVPTPAERAAFEESARFYEENGALHLTATLLGRRDEGPLKAGPVTFILADGKLVTVRQVRPRAFEIGLGRASARISSAQNGADVMLALIEGAAERLADVLAEATRDANALSVRVFDKTEELDLRTELRNLGRIGALSALAHDSLSSMQRLLVYARAAKGKHGLDAARVAALGRDVGELERIAEQMQPRLSNLQDAMLGLINAQQTNVLKALSLATIAFVPPTLIASIFGMNFDAMTWFRESWGPWVGIALMLIAPAALFAIAKWRRWF
ncbi:MAG TPA: CorA family divalent cation transporter [Vitreimonas sp.]|uniref:CorA family divalent cation transporter n=1 Tax=Vitreimonas sp. TaxID=3069702 RepID=UPI002D4E902D|nr:CorA family divalent cation transporter [Vitreimonas sp.]HYD87220.1 CorA family divalent cation transporter [Vitreimonas sp.]